VGYNQIVPLRLIRLLAIALAVAVPIQGMAVITAGQCMALGHHQDTSGHDSQAKDGHDGHDHAAHSHADEADHADGEASDGKAGHCGPCTACCASASIAGPAAMSILSSTSDAPYVFSQSPPMGVQPDGLDRPPLAL
jgi:hypothetical protein